MFKYLLLIVIYFTKVRWKKKSAKKNLAVSHRILCDDISGIFTLGFSQDFRLRMSGMDAVFLPGKFVAVYATAQGELPLPLILHNLPKRSNPNSSVKPSRGWTQRQQSEAQVARQVYCLQITTGLLARCGVPGGRAGKMARV